MLRSADTNAEYEYSDSVPSVAADADHTMELPSRDLWHRILFCYPPYSDKRHRVIL